MSNWSLTTFFIANIRSAEHCTEVMKDETRKESKISKHQFRYEIGFVILLKKIDFNFSILILIPKMTGNLKAFRIEVYAKEFYFVTF